MPDADLDRLRTEYAERARRSAEHDPYGPQHPHNLFMYQQRDRAVIRLLRRHDLFPLHERQILEVGCGQGRVLLDWLRYGADPAHLHGVDLLCDRVTAAHDRVPSLRLVCADGQQLPYASGQFDLVLQFTAFSSVLDAGVRQRMAAEMHRVLKPGGALIWYDFWLNPTNPQTVGLPHTAIRQLFPDCSLDVGRITLAPPITRRLVRYSWSVCQLLESARMFNSHLLGLIRPQS